MPEYSSRVEAPAITFSSPDSISSSQQFNRQQEVTVTDIKMPFGSMVAFMVKWTIAAIPAMIILFVVSITIAVILLAIVSAFGVGLGAIAPVVK